MRKKYKESGGAGLWKKLSEAAAEKLRFADRKKILMMGIPCTVVFYLVEKLSWLYRRCPGNLMSEKLWVLFLNYSQAFESLVPSLCPNDLAAGLSGAALFGAAVYLKGKDAKKFRKGVEYGSARWGA